MFNNLYGKDNAHAFTQEYITALKQHVISLDGSMTPKQPNTHPTLPLWLSLSDATNDKISTDGEEIMNTN